MSTTRRDNLAIRDVGKERGASRAPVRSWSAHGAGRRGFTLAESLIASVVLAIAVVGVVTTITASHQQAAASQSDSQAVALARQLMEEIASKPLLAPAADPTPGWPTETNRANYDSVNDYANYQDGTPLPTLEGTTRPEIAIVPFTRLVTLRNPALIFGTAPAAGEVVIVEVKARDATGRTCTLHRLFTRANVQR
jgi:prepilin-type N-terminal cleavage/methylation domain-containing protein